MAESSTRIRKLVTPPLVVTVCALFLIAGGPVVDGGQPAPHRVVWDGFRDGFTGADAR